MVTPDSGVSLPHMLHTVGFVDDTLDLGAPGGDGDF